MLSNEKGLFKNAKSAKVLPNIFVALLWAIIFIFAGQIAGVSLDRWISPNLRLDSSVRTSMSLILGFIFIALLIFLRVKFREKRPLASLGFDREGMVPKYLIGFGIGVAMFTGVVLILFWTGNIVVRENFTLQYLGGVLILLPAWMIQSATEEILARGWLMNVIGARYNALIGIWASSLFFGFIHLLNPHVDAIAVINIVLVGLFLSLYVVKTQNLWGVCGFHAAWNWAQGNIYGFAVSGLTPDGSTIFKMEYNDANWMNGGNFGPEAGLAATALLVLGICMVYRMIHKESQKAVA